ncbi:Retrovirus-related Pol polyprotein from transposon 412 [Eumeta japonica]|uniref:Retrovirus-related Pol polyprotein from transposon 412 n=1 Tax=Eumeta variegata TaxID=151549 RepID=A0A4C1TI04_EUMVA|nr:Retrovirus-related Pol polyprotein from transposon 412 [Eumeta japonica]
MQTRDLNSNTSNLTDVKTPNVLDDRRNKDVSSYSDVSKQDINRCEVNFNEHINLDEFEIVVDHLDLHQQAEIDTLLRKYKSVFAKDKYDVGTVRDYEAHIDLMVDKYCAKRPYRCTVNDRKEIEDQVSQLLKMKLIEESYSPFAAPVTLAYKKEDDKKTRLCIDFRELNKIVVPQSQPFPLIEDLMIKTVDCKYFSTLDINSAFWSIPLKVQDRIFDPAQPIKIYTDASIKGVGAILKQEDKTGVSKPVAYFSKKLTESQKKKKAIYLECLAIKESLKYWQHWLMGKEFVIYSDHKPLENLNIKARTDEELGDLMHYLSQYNFKVKYNAGQSNQEADCLSRNPVLEPDENTDDFLRVVNLINLKDIKDDQRTNVDLQNSRSKFILENEIYYKTNKKK